MWLILVLTVVKVILIVNIWLRKKIATYVLSTGRMLWIVVDGRS